MKFDNERFPQILKNTFRAAAFKSTGRFLIFHLSKKL